jgi:hypothetical protein
MENFSKFGSFALLSSILGITKEIMSRGPQVLDMEYREPYDLSLALEGVKL